MEKTERNDCGLLRHPLQPTVIFGPPVLCIANSDAVCISHSAQPLGLLDQLVNLLKLACLHTVLLRPGNIAPVLSSSFIWLAVRKVWCKVSVRVTRLTDSVFVGD